MAEIDPRIRQFEKEAEETLAAMKRSRSSAEKFERETRTTRDRTRLKTGNDYADEGGRRQGIGQRQSEDTRSLKERSRASRDVAKAEKDLARLNDQARASEARLTKQRTEGTKALLSREQAVKRYGAFAGNRFIERQASEYYARNPAAGGGAGAPPPPPPAPPGGGGAVPPGGGGPRGFNAALDAERRNLAALENQLAGSTRAHQRLIQVQASGSNVLRRHGALTTEFIQAAARGEVTIRELGFQTAATIGKFGGWITAGAAIYGALGAVQAMGKGALDAYSGVNQLQRVINNVDATSARREFSDLADYFQLPTADVTEGVYEIGKVFHDQNTALEASKALLYSVKVGELDVATAGRYLIAITNAYNLSASDLNGTFDKFNQLQNNFGVAISGTESATARAAGSFANAGGELDYLIALIGTASRVTGAAPERVGTALQRAPSFIHKPANESVLRSFGIDPNQDIDKVFDEAFKVAQQSSGKRRRQLAAAIFGPQYGAGIGTPLLRQYDEFLKQRESLEKSKGSGARELGRVKQSPEEQLKNIGVQLERLGTGLAESGLLSLLGAALFTLDDLLRLANSLVGVFNELPDPLRESLGILIQLGLAARLLGRLNLGDTIAPPGKEVGPARQFLGGAIGGGDRREARLVRKGLYDERTALEDERTRIADQAREQSSRAVLADERAVREQQRLVSLQSQAVKDEKAISESRRAVNAYAEEANVSREAALRLSLDEEAKARRLNEVNSQIGKTRGRFGGLNVPGTLEAAGSRRSGYYPTTFDVPTTARPGEYSAAIPAPGIPTTPIDLGELGRQEGRIGKAKAAARRTTQRLSRVNVSARGLGNSFNRMLGSMGNLIFAAFTIGFIGQELSNLAETVGDEFERVTEPANSAASQAERLKSLKADSTRGNSFAENVSDLVTGSGSIGGSLPEMLGLTDSEDGAGDIRRQTAKIIEARIKLIQREQRQARAQGKAVPFRFVSDIEKDIEKLKSGDRPAAQTRRLIARYEEELAKSAEKLGLASGSYKQQQARLKAARDELQRQQVESSGPKGLASALEGLEPKELQEQLQSEITQAGYGQGPTRNRIKRAATIYRAIQSRLGKSSDPEDIQQLADARNSFFQGLEQTIQDELDRALTISKSPAQRNRAYAQAFANLRQAYGQQDQGAIRQQQQKIQNLQRQLEKGQLAAQLVDRFGGLFGVTRKDVGLDKVRRQIKAETGALKDLRAQSKEKREFLRQIKTELRQQQYEENAAIRQAQTDLRVSRTSDPLKQAKLKLTALNTEIGKAIEVYGRSSKEVMELLSQRQEILAQQAQDQLNLIDAQGALRAAGLAGEGNEVARARVELSTLQSKLAYEQSHANRFDPAEVIQLRADIREAEIQLQEQIEDEAQKLAEAAIDVKIARAEAGGNDVRAARLELQKARYGLAHADTPLERKEARADVIGKRASLRDAAAQQEIEDVQFQADIGKLTLDQQISAYERILDTMKLTRDARRDLRTKIHGLKQETENEGAFDLNVGDIKLPTIYEIRRAIKGGVNGGGVNVSQRNTYNVRSTDPEGAAREIARLNGGANKAALRSAGIR